MMLGLGLAWAGERPEKAFFRAEAQSGIAQIEDSSRAAMSIMQAPVVRPLEPLFLNLSCIFLGGDVPRRGASRRCILRYGHVGRIGANATVSRARDADVCHHVLQRRRAYAM